MSFPQTSVTPKSNGKILDTRPESFGELESSNDLLNDVPSLHRRMEENGYLFLRDFLDKEQVREARQSIVEQMAAAGLLAPGSDPMDAVANPDPAARRGFVPDFAKGNSAVHQVLYRGAIIDFYHRFFGEQVLHFDFTWLRAIPPGPGTQPHCDMVYMGRGTRTKLFTAWVPYGETPLDVGGLIILEKSHRQHERLRAYLERDVDTYCVNGRHAEEIESGKKQWSWNGALAKDPVSLREKLGGRWLTAEFRPGDLLTFPMTLVHASLDNQSDHYRISSDSRYQPASEPADERWIGANPPGHSLAGKRGRIC